MLRIEPVTMAILAFVVFIALMAGGIAIDQSLKGGDPMEPNTPPRGPGNPPPGR